MLRSFVRGVRYVILFGYALGGVCKGMKGSGARRRQWLAESVADGQCRALCVGKGNGTGWNGVASHQGYLADIITECSQEGICLYYLQKQSET